MNEERFEVGAFDEDGGDVAGYAPTREAAFAIGEQVGVGATVFDNETEQLWLLRASGWDIKIAAKIRRDVLFQSLYLHLNTFK